MNAIASHRPYSWARVWRDLGHEVDVLTFARHPFDGAMDLERDLSGMAVHEIDYLPAPRARAASTHRVAAWEKLKTLTRRMRFSLGIFGDPRLMGYLPLVRHGIRLCAKRRFDVIVATSPPEVTFMVARTLHRRTGTPWVADFRDLWFRDMLLYRSRLASWLSGPLNKRLVTTASLITTVSQGLQKRLSEYLAREVLVFYNGFFRDEQPARGEHAVDSRRHIVYTGRLYPGKRDPEPLFRALTALREKIPDLAQRVSVDFYGFDDPWLRSLIERHEVADCVNLCGFLPYAESIAMQRDADVLLFLDWADAKAEGVLTGKLFEYFGSGRPILSIGPSKATEAARLIVDAGAGEALITDKEVSDYLVRLLSLPRPPAVPRARLDRFTRERQAEEFLQAVQARLPGRPENR